MKSSIRVLALAAYPEEAAATRWRVAQLRAPLAEQGIQIDLRPFIDTATFGALYDRRQWPDTVAGILAGLGRRLTDIARAGHYDVLLLQREAAFLGPPVVEWALQRFRHLPVVLDLDDAIWAPYESPTYGRLAGLLKAPGKYGWLIHHADIATCGNHMIAQYVTGRGTRAVVVPTVVDLERFRPRDPSQSGRDLPIIGWIGSHSTWQYVEPILPALIRVAADYPFRFLVVGHGEKPIHLPGATVEARPWSLSREVEDFCSLDIGLYPITQSAWAIGKSGLKAVQYMAAGIPFVASPVGAMSSLGTPGTTHLLARTAEEWYSHLARLISDAAFRQAIGKAGRTHAEAHFSVPVAVAGLASAIRTAHHNSGRATSTPRASEKHGI